MAHEAAARIRFLSPRMWTIFGHMFISMAAPQGSFPRIWTIFGHMFLSMVAPQGS